LHHNVAKHIADIRVFALQIVGNTDASTSLHKHPSTKEYAATHGLAQHAPISTAKEVLETLAGSKKGPLDFLQAIWKTLTLDLSPVDQIHIGPCMILDMAKEEFGATAVIDLYVLVHLLIAYLANRDTPWGIDPDGIAEQLLVKALGMQSEMLQWGAVPIPEGVAMFDSQTIGVSTSGSADKDTCACDNYGLRHGFTGENSRVWIKLKGRGIHMYLSTSPKPPLILTLLNGLALAGQLPNIVKDADDNTTVCLVRSKGIYQMLNNLLCDLLLNSAGLSLCECFNQGCDSSLWVDRHA
jgi:hypothetical protein